MSFAVIGVNHKNCPIEVRERVAFTGSKVLEGLCKLKMQGVKEVVILSTCNRSEVYIEDEDIEGASQKVIALYEEYFGESKGIPRLKTPMDKEILRPYLFMKRDEEAITHLLKVAVGLDSVVLGEDQILGQVKKAHSYALEQRTSGKVTNKIFREAISLARKVKNEVKISEHPLSISHIAIKFLKEKQGTLKGKKALIIGLGQMSELAIKYLQEEGLEAIYVTNRTHGKSIEFTHIYEGIIAVSYEKRYEIVPQVDIIISATASPHTILCYEEMPPLRKRLDIMDIAMPRDIDERISDLPFAYVYHIDHLKKISDENSAIRNVLAAKAETYIEITRHKLRKWLEQLEVEDVVQGLDAYCEEIKEHTMKFLNKKMDTSIDEATLELIMTETLKRCIRTPIATLMKTEEESKREEYVKALTALFEISN